MGQSPTGALVAPRRQPDDSHRWPRPTAPARWNGGAGRRVGQGRRLSVPSATADTQAGRPIPRSSAPLFVPIRRAPPVPPADPVVSDRSLEAQAVHGGVSPRSLPVRGACPGAWRRSRSPRGPSAGGGRRSSPDRAIVVVESSATREGCAASGAGGRRSLTDRRPCGPGFPRSFAGWAMVERASARHRPPHASAVSRSRAPAPASRGRSRASSARASSGPG